MHAMKTLKTLMLMVGLLISSTAFYSCLDSDDQSVNGNLGIVTIKPLSDNSYYMQLDDNTTLLPVNTFTPPNLKERRAVVSFITLPDSVAGYTYSVQVLYMDSILTKTIVEDLGAENDSIYGKDPIELHVNSSWVKGGAWIEDGYITFNFLSHFGGYKKHFLNLVQANSSNPYELEFRHNAYDDPKTTYQEGLVSFKLDKLPATEGKTVKLKIKYNSYEGDKTIELDYKTK